jgi:hypothetical protein
MAFVSIDTVAELQRKHKTAFWKVLDRTKRVEMDSQDQPIDLEQSIELLQNFLNSLSGDSCIVSLYTTAPEKTTAGSKMAKLYQLVVKLRTQDTAKPTPINGPFSLSDHLQLVEKIHELKMERLKAELESDQKKETAMEKFLGSILQPETINNLIAMVTQKKQNIETVSGIEAKESGNNKLADSLRKFQKVDPDFENTLAKMAEYLEKNPGSLASVKMVIGA